MRIISGAVFDAVQAGRWLGVSATGSQPGRARYLTVAQYTATTALACPNTGAVNGAKVTTSSDSRLFGVPVVLPGLIFFLAMVALQSPAGWRSTTRTVRLGRLALAGSGAVMVRRSSMSSCCA